MTTTFEAAPASAYAPLALHTNSAPNDPLDVSKAALGSSGPRYANAQLICMPPNLRLKTCRSCHKPRSGIRRGSPI